MQKSHQLTKNSQVQMGFEPMTLRDLAGRSNHWATGDSMVSEGEIWVVDWDQIAWSHNEI